MSGTNWSLAHRIESKWLHSFHGESAIIFICNAVMTECLCGTWMFAALSKIHYAYAIKMIKCMFGWKFSAALCILWKQMFRLHHFRFRMVNNHRSTRYCIVERMWTNDWFCVLIFIEFFDSQSNNGQIDRDFSDYYANCERANTNEIFLIRSTFTHKHVLFYE